MTRRSHIFECPYIDGAAVYVVEYSAWDLPPQLLRSPEAPQLLADVIATKWSMELGEPAEKRQISHDGAVGYELRYGPTQKNVIIRAYVKLPRSYMMTVTSPELDQPAVVKRFLGEVAFK